jgi:hypothetical protein
MPSSRSSAVIYDGFAGIVINGIQAEFSAGRISPPVEVMIHRGADSDSDFLELAKMERRIEAGLRDVFPVEQATLYKVDATDSEFDDLIQVADLYTGKVSQWVNQGVPDPQGNRKLC